MAKRFSMTMTGSVHDDSNAGAALAIAELTTLGDLLLRATATHGDRDALILPGERHTYHTLASAACDWARLLIARGVKPGEHIGLLLPNRLEFMEVLFGAILAGAVVVPINTRYRAHELAYVTENADLVMIITTGQVSEGLNLLDRLGEAFPDLAERSKSSNSGRPAAVAPKLRDILVLDGRAHAFLDARSELAHARNISDGALDARRRQVRVRDTCLILYTSGTTSNPKGCLLSHEALFRQGHAMAERYEFTATDRVWCPLPMSHVAGISPVVAAMTTGAAFVSMQKFEPAAALRQHADERVSVSYSLFAAVMTDMLYHPDAAVTDLSHIRIIVSNPAILSKRLATELQARLPAAVQIGTFGMTEVVGAACTHSPRDAATDRMTRLGRSLPGVEVKVICADGSRAASGETGEILLRGATMFSGYYKDPVKTADALRRGWFHTGDLGTLDADGSILFSGRLKDMLKVGGENVAAQELELFISQHPAVKLCAVVPIPDPRLDEVPAAFIELKPGMTTSEAEIIGFCTGRIASFKVPRYVRIVTEWPMGASKIQKFKLREMLLAELAPSPLTSITH